MENNAKIQFLEDWLASEKEYDEEMMFRQGLALGIDLYAPRIAVLLEISPDHLQGDALFEDKRRIIEKIIRFSSRSLRDALFLLKENTVILVMAGRQDESPRSIIKNLIGRCREASGSVIYAGMETRERTGMDLRTGIGYAQRALLANRLMDDAEDAPYRYTSLFWYSFIPDIPDNTKIRMIRLSFPEYSDDEIREMLPVLYLFYDREKDYRSTANLLHVHPNTLRYRMERLQKKSGIDPRSPEGTSRYLLAFYLWVYFHPEEFRHWKETYGIRLNKNLYRTVIE